MGSKPKMPKPTDPNYGGATTNLLGTYNETTPGVQAFEGMARPGYTGLNLGDITSFLQGVGGQEGYISQLGRATGQAQDQLTSARGGEMSSMTGQAGAARGLLGAMSPEAEQMMRNQASLAQQSFQEAQGMSPEATRNAQQAAREAYAARGQLGGNASVAAEVLNRESAVASRRANAANLSGQAYQTSQNYYSPMQGILGGTPASMAFGQNYMTTGAGQIGRATPQLFDYSTAFGIEQSRVGAQDAYNQAKYQQKLQNYQSNIGLIGTLGGAAVGTMFGNPMLGASIGGALTGSPSAGLGTKNVIDKGFSMPSFLGGAK